MALKAKSNETNESSDDEDSKMKSYITRQFKKFMKNANGKGFDKDRRQSIVYLVFFNLFDYLPHLFVFLSVLRNLQVGENEGAFEVRDA